MSGPVYALNLFDVSKKEEYLAYSRRSAGEVQAHGGRVVAFGRLREAATGSRAALGTDPRRVGIQGCR
jgi:uncharacterized protein (DUF1330 family)